MKQQKMMSEQNVVDALKFGKELPHLKDQFQLLVEEINNLEYKRNGLRTVLSALQNQISAAKDSLKTDLMDSENKWQEKVSIDLFCRENLLIYSERLLEVPLHVTHMKGA